MHFEQVMRFSSAQRQLDLDALVGLSLGSLHRARAGTSVRAHIFEVYRGGDHFDVIERELRALADNVAVDDDQGTAVVIEAVAVTALLVGVEVDAAELVATDSEQQTDTNQD